MTLLILQFRYGGCIVDFFYNLHHGYAGGVFQYNRDGVLTVFLLGIISALTGVILHPRQWRDPHGRWPFLFYTIILGLGVWWSWRVPLRQVGRFFLDIPVRMRASQLVSLVCLLGSWSGYLVWISGLLGADGGDFVHSSEIFGRYFGFNFIFDRNLGFARFGVQS